MTGWLVAGSVVTGAAALFGLWRLARMRPVTPADARRQFAQQREHLEADFFQAAVSSGKPRGLRWKECDWGDSVVIARDRHSGRFVAVAGVTIAFEAVEGGDMEGLPAVGNLRSASALFVHDGVRWRATHRTVFNLNPDEVIDRFADQYERLDLP